MSKKILFTLMTVVLAIGLIGAGAFALFSDVETVEVGDISAGTLDLTVNDQNPCTEHITVGDVYPGWWKKYEYTITNIGTLEGKLTVELSSIINKENGRTEPEIEAGDVYGPLDGELGEYLKLYVGIWEGTRFLSSKEVTLTKWGNNPTWTPYDLHDPMSMLGGSSYTVIIKATLLDDPNINIVQSDSVEFDIIFHLDQAP